MRWPKTSIASPVNQFQKLKVETTKSVIRQTFKNKPEWLRNHTTRSIQVTDEHPLLTKTVSVGRLERLKMLNRAERQAEEEARRRRLEYYSDKKQSKSKLLLKNNIKAYDLARCKREDAEQRIKERRTGFATEQVEAQLAEEQEVVSGQKSKSTRALNAFQQKTTKLLDSG